MPSIQINVVDQTSQTPVVSTTTQMASIVGFATQGPINEPIECYSLLSFYSTFGNSAPLNSDSVTVDLSWNLAKQLLLQGMPILYTRIADDSTVETASYTLTSGSSVNTVQVDAVSPGTWGNNLSVTVNSAAENGAFTMSVLLNGTVVSVINASTVSTASNYVNNISNTYVTLSDIRSDGVGTAVTMNTVESQSLSGGDDGLVDLSTNLTLLDDVFTLLSDRTLYNFSYFCIPGLSATQYTTQTGDSSVVAFATTRDDCIVVIDPAVTLTTANDLIQWSNQITCSNAATFYPWITTTLEGLSGRVLPPSFAYLIATAISQQTYSPWYAVAGVTRGALSFVTSTTPILGSTVSDEINSAFVNPISKYRQYGYVINGNNVLNQTATSRIFSQLSVRCAINYCKSAVYNICQALTFQPSTSILWSEFTGRVIQVLDGVKANEGIYDYSVQMDDTTMQSSDQQNGIVRGVVKIYPTPAAEEFIIQFEIANENL